MAPHLDEKLKLELRLDDLMQQHRKLLDRLQQGQKYFQQLARSVWRVQEEERRRLARDLHDGVGQNLTVMIHMLNQSLEIVADSSPDLHANLKKMHALIESTLDDTRTLSRLLRPQILDDLGLEAALSWLTRTVAQANTLKIHMDIARPMPVLNTDHSTLIYRLLQEALANVVRHAHANRVDIVLRASEERIFLSVQDDGRGCDVQTALSKSGTGQSTGLGGMRDRARLFEGEFRLQSGSEGGLRIDVDFPLQFGAGGAT